MFFAVANREKRGSREGFSALGDRAFFQHARSFRPRLNLFCSGVSLRQKRVTARFRPPSRISARLLTDLRRRNGRWMTTPYFARQSATFATGVHQRWWTPLFSVGDPQWEPYVSCGQTFLTMPMPTVKPPFPKPSTSRSAGRAPLMPAGHRSATTAKHLSSTQLFSVGVRRFAPTRPVNMAAGRRGPRPCHRSAPATQCRASGPHGPAGRGRPAVRIPRWRAPPRRSRPRGWGIR